MVAAMRRRRRARGGIGLVVAAIGGMALAGVGAALLGLLLSVFGAGNECLGSPNGSIALGPPGTGRLVGATEYGGPGDPSSGAVGSSGANLIQNPDTYAELGGDTFQTATAMGGLTYMTPLRITWGSHSAVAYKRDIGLGGGPIDGLPRVIDLWWQLAGQLGIPYENGLWSGPVRIERPPSTGAASALGQTDGQPGTVLAPRAPASDPGVCAPGSLAGVTLVPGSRAHLLPNGQAAAPTDAPVAVREMIAAGNEIVGKPYVYGGGHGLSLAEIAPSYDCSSSVEHVLYGARLVPVTYGGASGELESFGAAGPGAWVTVYASAGHVFMYVAGLRWDTHDAAGPGDGSGGIGWHPLIRSSDGFVARHPEGL
jgi:hypothetical protein